ncbi:MAG: hypothetical protein AB8F95_15875 [Bacteroidia bacterium]
MKQVLLYITIVSIACLGFHSAEKTAANDHLDPSLPIDYLFKTWSLKSATVVSDQEQTIYPTDRPYCTLAPDYSYVRYDETGNEDLKGSWETMEPDVLVITLENEAHKFRVISLSEAELKLYFAEEDLLLELIKMKD